MIMLTAEHLREILDYDQESGLFIWKIRPRSRTPIGSIAGFTTNGIVKIGIDGRDYRAHRLAFLWMNGAWPKNEVDHKDRNPLNNSWNNLREATRIQNLANRRVRKDSKSGLKGVYLDRKRNKYKAHIAHNGVQIFLGRYNTAQDAHNAHLRAAHDLNGEYAGS